MSAAIAAASSFWTWYGTVFHDAVCLAVCPLIHPVNAADGRRSNPAGRIRRWR